MGTIENLQNLFSRENWRYSALLFWLILGILFMEFVPIIGVFIFLPLLAFLVFLFFFSLAVKKNIEEYPSWMVITIFFVALPFMFLIFTYLVILMIGAVIVYIFLTSWFTIYGCYLTANGIDKQLKKRRYNALTRGIEFFGGSLLAIFFLVGFALGSVVYIAVISPNIPLFLMSVFIIIGIIIIGFTIISFGYLIKTKFLAAFVGIFLVLVSFYTFFLVLKVFLGLGSSGSSSQLTKIALMIFDFFILIYAMSSILGSQAKILTEKLKYFGIDTVMILLIASKVSYEFAVNFPYDLLKIVFSLGEIPYLEEIVDIGSNLNLYKNITILILFILLFIFIGIHEIRKYISIEKEILKEKDMDIVEKEMLVKPSEVEMEPISELEENVEFKDEIKEEEYTEVVKMEKLVDIDEDENNIEINDGEKDLDKEDNFKTNYDNEKNE